MVWTVSVSCSPNIISLFVHHILLWSSSFIMVFFICMAKITLVYAFWSSLQKISFHINFISFVLNINRLAIDYCFFSLFVQLFYSLLVSVNWFISSFLYFANQLGDAIQGIAAQSLYGISCWFKNFSIAVLDSAHIKWVWLFVLLWYNQWVLNCFSLDVLVC